MLIVKKDALEVLMTTETFCTVSNMSVTFLQQGIKTDLANLPVRQQNQVTGDKLCDILHQQ